MYLLLKSSLSTVLRVRIHIYSLGPCIINNRTQHTRIYCSSRMVSLSTVLRSPSCLPHITRRALHTSTLRFHDKAAQPQTPATENIELGAVCIVYVNPIISPFANLPLKPITYISKSHDPWFNLSYEDWYAKTFSVQVYAN